MSLLISTSAVMRPRMPYIVGSGASRAQQVAQCVRESVKRTSAHIVAMRHRFSWLADDVQAQEAPSQALRGRLNAARARVAARASKAPVAPAVLGYAGLASFLTETRTYGAQMFQTAVWCEHAKWPNVPQAPIAPVRLMAA